jgi:hypothetical protein
MNCLQMEGSYDRSASGTLKAMFSKDFVFTLTT